MTVWLTSTDAFYLDKFDDNDGALGVVSNHQQING